MTCACKLLLGFTSKFYIHQLYKKIKQKSRKKAPAHAGAF